MFFADLDGNFLDGYRIKDGKITKRLIPKQKTNIQKASMFLFFQKVEESEEDDKWDCWEYSGGELDEVVIVASGGEGSNDDYSDLYSTNLYGFNTSDGSDSSYDGNSGGGTSVTSAAGTVYTTKTSEDSSEVDENETITVESVPPNCKSFKYTRVGTTNWQTAAVSGIRELFTVFNWKCTGFDFGTLPQAIYFQIPINAKFSLDSGYTKTESAATLHEAFKAFDIWYKNNACTSSYSQMTTKFLNTIKEEFEEIGGNATVTPPLGYTGTINSYSSTFYGYGNCY